MSNRITSVGSFKNSVTDNISVVQIGDSEKFIPLIYSIAVQREKAIFYDNEFNYRDYTLFSRSLSHPVITENITMTRMNETPVIQAGDIYIFRITGSSLAQLGSSGIMKAEVRIKNIRHLLREPSS
ncbi:spore germination protein GerPE [Paenibacillus sp. SI8]|uniref:spore germination protein GerPE n=1 Tax=unclassified Paenibacillus TaxID=185978 RepID=UPI003466BB34